MAKKRERSGTYRPKKTYLGTTPEKRQAQLANLQSRHKDKHPGTKPVPARASKVELSKLDIIEFATDWLGVSFKRRPAQEVLLRAQYGLPFVTSDQWGIYKQLCGGESYQGVESDEGVWAIGARGGKSFLSSVVALFEAICRGDHWRKFLNKGEIGFAIITATRQKQAEQIIQANCARLIENSRVKYMLVDSLQQELKLRNGLCVGSFPCNSTAARGLPIFLLVFDEIAHYYVAEGMVNQDERIYSALRPRQAQFPGAKCLKISTPAAKKGLFWDEFSQGFSVPGRLTVQAATRLLNPEIPEAFIESERVRNVDNYEREFLAQFAEQMDAYFDYDLLSNCFVLVGDLPYEVGNVYYAGIDQSGLAGRDKFAFSISHEGLDGAFVDVARSWSTKNADLIFSEIGDFCKAYKITTVSVDRYAIGYVQRDLEKLGLIVTVRSDLPVIYSNLKSLIIAGKLRLPENRELKNGLVDTSAFYGRSNQLSIAHTRSTEGHGDLADSVATSVFAASHWQVSEEFRRRVIDPIGTGRVGV